jgi:hypothetical protein
MQKLRAPERPFAARVGAAVLGVIGTIRTLYFAGTVRVDDTCSLGDIEWHSH